MKSTVRTLIVGILSLAVAMGIGRFAFTPMLPLMIRDGQIDAIAGADWATANYIGYLLGAVTAHRLRHRAAIGLVVSLWGITVSTALLAAAPGAVGGFSLRLISGIFSAWTLVLASSWCLQRLAWEGASSLGALIYGGVGLGITLSGAWCWLGANQTSGRLWEELAGLALVGTAAVALLLRPDASLVAPDAHSPVDTRRDRSHWNLIASYGCFGFGYIVPATFLPLLARAQFGDRPIWGLVWPAFGLAAMVSVAVMAKLGQSASRRRVWEYSQILLAIGVCLPAVGRGELTLIASATLVGGTFLVITSAGLQLARELALGDPTRLMACMTASFAIGQIAGPVVARLVLGEGRDASAAISGVSWIAVAALISGILLLKRDAA